MSTIKGITAGATTKSISFHSRNPNLQVSPVSKSYNLDYQSPNNNRFNPLKS